MMGYRKYLQVVIASVLCLGLLSVKTLAQEAGPQLAFAQEKHDFGDMAQGEVVKFDFTFTNTGGAPLVLSKVATTCGCTAPQWPKGPIAPGESGKITVQFDSKGKMGIQNKLVTIYSNAEEPQKRIKIMANVLPKEG